MDEGRTRSGIRRSIDEWRAFGAPRYRTFLGIGSTAAVVAALAGDGLTIPLLLALGTHPAVATVIGVLPFAFSVAQLRVPWLLDRTDGDLRRVTLVILAVGETRGFLLALFTLLDWAGFGVAVANAHPDVLARADLIVPPVQEEGVATLLEAYLDSLP